MSEMLEKILSDKNIKIACKRVYSNKGASGIDGVTVQELEKYMQDNWKSIKEEIQERKYKPQPVKRVEIPKPNGGVRKLGVPTVIDRVIEQAITQVLTTIFDPIFSENSYGFRPNRRCEQAIIKLLEYFNDGYVWIEQHLRRMMILVIWKQWKVSKKRAWGLTKLGINPWQAKLTAGIGDRYIIISKHPAVKKAISKEKLTKRGLISLSDYYAEHRTYLILN